VDFIFSEPIFDDNSVLSVKSMSNMTIGIKLVEYTIGVALLSSSKYYNFIVLSHVLEELANLRAFVE